MPEPLALAPPPVDPLANQNYRIRRLVLKLDLDIYDDGGFLINRGTTDDVILNEVEITQALAAQLAAKTSMTKGFFTRPLEPSK